MDPESRFSLPVNNIPVLHILITLLADGLTFVSEMLSSAYAQLKLSLALNLQVIKFVAERVWGEPLEVCRW